MEETKENLYLGLIGRSLQLAEVIEGKTEIISSRLSEPKKLGAPSRTRLETELNKLNEKLEEIVENIVD
jgi:hypothetical protein